MTACANSDDAKPIIEGLLEKRLAACVQALPIDSHYIWKGKVENASEVLLLIKCKTSNFAAIKDEILRLHPYELPEIVQIPIADGLDRYLAWIGEPF
jgi:periplasmic divalent cation tolerance protein